MGPIEQLKGELAAFLAGQLPDCILLGAYPAHFAPPEPEKIPLVVGVRSVDLQEGALGGYVGEEGNGLCAHTGGKLANVTLEFTLLHPKQAGEVLQQQGEALMDLLLTQTLYPIVRLAQETLTFDRALGSLHLTITAQLQLFFTAEEHPQEIREIQFKQQDTPPTKTTENKEEGLWQ